MPDKEQSPSVTDAMIKAGVRVLEGPNSALHRSWKDEKVEQIYVAMHAARPTPDLGKDKELVERLRRYTRDGDTRAEMPINPDGPEAAARMEALLAEREKLREALQEIADFTPDADIMAPPPHSQIATFAKKTARAALSIGETDYCGIVVMKDSPDAP